MKPRKDGRHPLDWEKEGKVKVTPLELSHTVEGFSFGVIENGI